MDAETGQRGFVLTGENAYLQPYTAVQQNLRSDLQALRQSNTLQAAQKHLDAVVPLLDTEMAYMDRAIALRRANNIGAVMAVVNSGEGKRTMDAIRAELLAFNRLQEDAQLQGMALFDASMRRMFAIIVCIGVLALLLALYFVYASVRAAQQRLKNAVHLETQHLLTIQTESNRQLLQSNHSLQISQEKLAVTLNSIGDAVIATDAEAHVTLLNRVAEALTGWTQAQALGRPLDEVFRIIGKDSRQPVALPVTQVLARGTTQGMVNHTVLIARDGGEFDIADSCAPIRDSDGAVIGAVLVFRDVTADLTAQRALRDSAALVQAVLNTVVDGIVTVHASGGHIESANAAIEKMFGYNALELCGQTFDMLIPELDQMGNNVPLGYLLATHQASATGQAREGTGRRKDGSVFPLEMAVSEMTLGGERYFTAMLRDITARKQNEMSLRKASALQYAIFNSANFSYIATDAQGTIQVFNVGAESMLGYTAAAMIGRRAPDSLCDPQDLLARTQHLRIDHQAEVAPGFETLVFNASRGIEDIFELSYLHHDGSSFPVVVSVTALRDDDATIIGYLLIGIDNRTRRRLEAERFHLDLVLRDRNMELETARAVADRANQAKSEFLSNMSHELRSPLNAILGFAQLIETGNPAPTPKQRGNIEQILKAGWYLLELINEVLDLALVESGRLSMSMEPVLLPEVLADCQTMMEPVAHKRNILMRFPVFEAPVYIQADRTRVKQVLINLLSNAIKYNHAGGTVEVTCQQMTPKRTRVSVRDSGAGLSAEKLTLLFQPFNRLGQESGTKEGTGIGLAISKRLVELMGGTIGAQSTVGVGSIFWIELNSEGNTP